MADFIIEIGGRPVGFDDVAVAAYKEADWVAHGLESKMIQWMGDKQEAMLKYVYSKACERVKPAPTKPPKKEEAE